MIVCDIYGKNYYSVGSFGNYVCSMDLLIVDGEICYFILIGEDVELFWVIVGGNGFIGIIMWVIIEMMFILMVYFIVDGDVIVSFDEIIVLYSDGSEVCYIYFSVWFDVISVFLKLGCVVVLCGCLVIVE